ncbi:glucose-1-phosphate adenylyltransferase family protein [Tersicoccus sp. Bi-70]|uniref:glucose-1-phosphate adenylyltransferase family protein n=1 Tax=Tersicoccus sp. Bi-70 TaxID=1897634 RepID=UPI0009772F74|nr:glucose-1-phosphate adenylyltransferase family protein [Tersicoccus sp. Bi-70]OMH35199.1 glucose-1-phosphate adenylyltransferase [Tersicoccus sp. Bi-70]
MSAGRSRPSVLAVLLAGGAGSRLGPLTQDKAKPALPFAGSYHLVDVPLSNLVHSNLTDVWVIEQFQPHYLNEHVANGRPWDLDRTHGGLRLLPPFQGDDGEGFAQGNADALYRQAELIREFDPDLVLTLSADHLYRLDYRDVIDTHLAAGADLTMVTTEVDGDVSRFSVVQAEDGRVTDFAYKPEKPTGSLVGTEVFLYDTDVLLDTLGMLLERDGKLEDYGDALVPHLVEHGSVVEHRLEGYWRDVGTIESYWEAHQELLRGTGFDVADAAWPMYTAQPQTRPAFIAGDATVRNSLVSPGAEIHGTVIDSVIGPRVVVEAGATVRGSVVMDDVVVARDATVATALVDLRVRIGAGAQVGADDPDRSLDSDGDGDAGITVLGSGHRVADGERVPAGAQVPATD